MQRSFAKPNGSTERFERTSSSYSIYIVPLPTDIEQKDLRLLFSICGSITRVQILYTTSRYGYVFAYVNFSTMEAREKAKKLYNGKMLGLRCLKVVNDKGLKEPKMKRDTHDWGNETVYEVEVSRCESMPKKRVHTNESGAEISRSFYQDHSREISSSSQYIPPKSAYCKHKSSSKDRYERRESSPKKISQERSKDQVSDGRESFTSKGDIEY